MSNETPTDKGSFDALKDLVNSIEIESPKNGELKESVPKENKEANESERIKRNDEEGEKFLEEYEKDIVAVGRYSYYEILGDKESLTAEGAPGMFWPHVSTHVHLGPYFTFQTADKRNIEKPEDYIVAYDDGMRFFEQIISDIKKEGGEIKPRPSVEEFYREHSEEVLLRQYEPGSRIRLVASLCVKDFSPEIAYKLYYRINPGAGHRIRGYEQTIIDMKNSLKGFCETALDRSDVETAIEGYKRLDKLDDVGIVQKMTGIINKLMDSTDPSDREKLMKIAKKIREING